MPLNRPLFILILLALAAFGLIRTCGSDTRVPISRSRILMGTVVEITAYGRKDQAVDEAVTAAFAEIARIENLMSPHIDGSDLDRIARSDAPVEVAPETAEVIALGLEIQKLSAGSFDMALGGLKELWAIESEQPRVPSRDAIEAALRGTGPGGLELQGRLLRRAQPHLHLDLGAIAKGYAVDRAEQLLRSRGIESAAINAGGDLRMIGSKQGKPWRIGIQHPRDAKALLATLEVEDISVVTSGDYERFFEQDGHRYHHIFDPGTGYPSDRCQSVTVVTASAALADALATALFVLGPERGLELVKQFPGTEALVVGADGKSVWSPGLEGRIRWP